MKSKLAQKLNIPDDLSDGLPIVTITGKKAVYVENYKGIIEYSNCCIKIQTKCGRISFAGRELEIVYYTNNDMKISGTIENIIYT